MAGRFVRSVAAGAKETTISWDNLVYMQDMTPEACSQAPLNTQKTLTDIRDGNTYTVVRIQNKTNTTALCWMTQNLRLIGGRTLTPADSDVSDNFLLITSTSLSSNDNPKQFSSSDQYKVRSYYEGNITYGAYYNWYTTTAGTGTESIINGTTNANGGSSICPKGWRLPTGGNNTGEFYNLLNGFTKGADITIAPYNFVYGGYINSSALNYAGSDGYYWSAMASSSSHAYLLSSNSSNVNPSYSYSRYYGASARCVAR